MPDGEQIETGVIHTGDCLDVLDEMPESSVHAVVTDPPYAEGDYDGFMGRSWDAFDGALAFQAWTTEWATAAKRVLKPGGHLLAFGSDDGHHRTACGIEDAGFEIRTHINWIYGGGFPKSLDVSKSIDKQADAEREVVGRKYEGNGNGSTDKKYGDYTADSTGIEVTVPATDAAKKWDGWKTGLKPATEFVVVARAPLSEGTVAENVLEHGTGALNIEACRVGSDTDTSRPVGNMAETQDKYGHYDGGQTCGSVTGGRYPSNVVFDERAAAQLDREVGELDGGARTPQSSTGRNTSNAPTRNGPDERVQLESGGPSRYFKTHGWDEFARETSAALRFKYTSKASKAERTLDGRIDNPHPTVKPLDLMGWLVTLVTAEGQTVLDPFAGSGTTLRSSKDKGRQFIGIEQQDRWADLARVRCGLTPEDPSNVRGDGAQTGLEVYDA